jgi:polyketide synthase PksM
MARAAVVASLDNDTSAPGVIELENIVWMRPVVVSKVSEVSIALTAGDHKEVEFEIYSTEQGVTSKEVIHVQGRAVLRDASSAEAVTQIDLSLLRGRCDQVIDVAQCYATFNAMGIEYGLAHRGLTSMQLGVDAEDRRFVLAQVQLPECVSKARDQFVLHPSVLDSALQASIGLSLAQSIEHSTQPVLPFALERLQILARSPDIAWVVVRPIVSASTATQKLDIDICDEAGRVCVRMRGITSRVLDGELQTATSFAKPNAQIGRAVNEASSDASLLGTILLTPHWEALMPPVSAVWPASASTVLLVGGTQGQQQSWQARFSQLQILAMEADISVEAIAEGILAAGSIDHVVWLAPASALDSIIDKSIIEAQAAGVIELYRLIKALLSQGYGVRSLGFSVVTWQTQAVHPDERIDPTHASVHGLIGSLAKEYETWKIRLVDLPIENTEAETQSLLGKVLSLPADPQGNAWAYRNGEWYRQQLLLREVHVSPVDSYRQDGVYVVIGGAGGLGEVFSEHLIKHHQAQMVWIGRREVNTEIQAKIDRLAMFGPAPWYICADATDQESLENAYQKIKAQHRTIHGLVHAAIALLDKSLERMEEARFTASLASKVDVSVRMAQVFAAESLDFVLFFSSLQSFAKAAGQSNYAAGCTFKDAFARHIAQTWACPIKVMNWGYWGSVGIVASESYRSRMAHQGIGSIESEEGMAALAQLFCEPTTQLVFLKTTQPRVLTGIAEVSERMLRLEPLFPSMTERLSQRTERVIASKTTDSQDTEMRDDLQRLMSRLLLGQLQSLGLFIAASSSISAWQQQNRLSAVYERWLAESIRLLANQGYLTVVGDLCIVSDPRRIDIGDLWAEWDERRREWGKDPNLSAQVNFVDAALRALPTILMGKQLATDVLFPNSSMEFVEGIDRRNLVADYFNAVLADAVIEFIEARLKQDSTARIRILEIGAGTGGTSAGIFTRLMPYESAMAEYCYTDISKGFLMHADLTYAATTPYMTTRLFNVEQPPKSQGIDIGAYDVVIATNVLHATKHIRRTLRNAKATLKKNGLLLLNEISDHSLFAHLTFGLSDECWWLYEDAALRIPGTPALSPEAWRRVLEGEGFQSVLFPAHTARELGQQIIVAQSDGMIRQPRVIASEQVGAAKAQNGLEKKSVRTSLPTTPPKRLGAGVVALGVEQRVREEVIQQLASSLKVDVAAIDLDESFADYGMDSIMSVRTVGAISQALSIRLQTTNLFDYPTVNKLTAFVLLEHQTAISSRFTDSTKFSDETLPPLTEAKGAPENHSSLKRDVLGRRGASSVQDVATAATRHPLGDRSVQREPIAIIGMSGRYPKASTVNELWEHLANGRELLEPVSRWELPVQNSSEADQICRRGGFLAEIDRFDSLFFNISGLEATYMDPQQRIFLEEAWNALEDAGYVGSLAEGRLCGVYVGCAIGDYAGLFNGKVPAQSFWGNAGSITPARVSYYLDLQGPAVAVDTACSSSLVAVHLACQGLWSGEMVLALAGGISVQCSPAFYLLAGNASMLSPSGRCHTFDDRADGFVPGEGVGVVVLKRVSDALSDGDHIYGVIRGSGINQDGTTNGITAPSAISQERLERQVYETFHIHPQDIQLVEAHGTGTKLGDPIEFRALTQSFRHSTDKNKYCAIGSIKTNIGHTLMAAGVAGVIKILLALKHKQLPPSLNYEKGNSHIDFENSPFYVNTILREWEVTPGKKRCAAVSSFGFSGTNAHVVIEEAPIIERTHADLPGYLIVLSARNAEQLKAQAERLVRHCQADTTIDCGNISYTLLLGRKHFNHRLACAAHDAVELTALLMQWLANGKAQGVFVSVVNEKDSGEHAALTRYGNQCIDECRADMQGDAYRESLATIADLFVQGYRLSFEKLFAVAAYSRLSLPSYPFAGERYWVANNGARAPDEREFNGKPAEDDGQVSRIFDVFMRNECSVAEFVSKLRLELQD